MMQRLASLKLTLIGLAVLSAAVVYAAQGVHGSWVLALPLALLAANLAAAIAVQRAFRVQMPLLVFHLALLALVLLAAAGRLTYLKGRIELSSGEAFSGELAQMEAGPLHRSRLGELSFTNEGFDISYSPGLQRNETRNRVTWSYDNMSGAAVIGDQEPLALAGYRFYTSSNKGFALILTWRGADGPAQRGTVHLPSYPMYDYRQAQAWTPPGASDGLWLMLDLDEPVIDPQKSAEFRLPKEHALIVRSGGQRALLRPGERLAAAGGVLTYEGLTTWMGYNVFYDWTLPWLLAAGLIAVASLGWHFCRKFSAQAWDA